jgi:hypothetical protein
VTKSVRSIAIADHLWEALGQMSAEVGQDREALLHQALHVFARQSGYLGADPVQAAARSSPATPPPPEDPGRRAVAEQVLQTAAALEKAIQERTPPEGPPPVPAAGPPGAPTLYLLGEDGELDKVVKDRFVIGRGKHCDLVIDSAKVSREHATILREGDGYVIEDLGSSNGTWHQRARVQRRRIEDGDEYFICSEKIRCVLR